MDPNSKNQFWGKWTLTAERPLFAPQTQLSEATAEMIKRAWANVVRTRLGRTGSVQASHRLHSTPKGAMLTTWTLEALIEDLNQNDPSFERIARKHLDEWARDGFGSSAKIEIEYKRMAGDGQDGKPPDQMLIVDQPIVNESKLHGG